MLIILDRDGVINEDSEAYIKSPDEWHPISGSLEAIAKLKKAGCQVAVATNQSGIAKGLFTEDTLQRIHQKMLDSLKQLGVSLDGIFFCPHAAQHHCYCRKPKPGLLFKIAQSLNRNLSSAILIGDSLRDIQAAKESGAHPILVLTGNGRQTLSQLTLNETISVYPNLAAAVEIILSTGSGVVE